MPNGLKSKVESKVAEGRAFSCNSHYIQISKNENSLIL